MSRHTDLIDEVNDATTEAEHRAKERYLQGWRDGVIFGDGMWSVIDADEHTEARFPGRPVCWGVLLDWAPAEVADPFIRHLPASDTVTLGSPLETTEDDTTLSFTALEQLP